MSESGGDDFSEDSDDNAARRRSSYRTAQAPATVLPLRAVAESSAPGTVQPGPVTFDQRELRLIFNVYGRKVAGGEWRDYALDFLKDQAVFSIFRRSTEVPLYRIEKTPRLARKQGLYAAVAASGLVLKRGHELERVIAVLDRPLKVVR